MNCKLHPTKTAVAKCEICGAGVCEDCAKMTASTGNYCVKCAYNETVKDITFDNELREIFKKSAIKLLIAWILGLVLFIVGLIIVLTAKSSELADINPVGLILLGLGILISGFPAAIQFWKKGSENFDKYEEKFGSTYHVSESGVYKEQGIWLKLLYALYGLLFGLVADPVTMLKYRGYIKEIDAELEEIKPIRTSLAKYYNNNIKNKD